jgi:hypothetical protein
MLSFLLIPPDGIEAGIIPGDPDGPQRDPSEISSFSCGELHFVQ